MMSPAISYDALCDFFKQLGSYEQPSVNAKREWGTELVTNTGIYLEQPPLRNCGYDATPVNSVMLARTGGDGVHFSFVTKAGVWSEASPIVMTCPSAGSELHNVIVGANLVEFLRLGIRTGYFSLARLSQTRSFSENSFVLEDLSSGRMASWLGPEAVAKLESLARRFELIPWENVGERLEQFQQAQQGGAGRHHARTGVARLANQVVEADLGQQRQKEEQARQAAADPVTWSQAQGTAVRDRR